MYLDQNLITIIKNFNIFNFKSIHIYIYIFFFLIFFGFFFFNLFTCKSYLFLFIIESIVYSYYNNLSKTLSSGTT
jgi:hypothetical protein